MGDFSSATVLSVFLSYPDFVSLVSIARFDDWYCQQATVNRRRPRTSNVLCNLNFREVCFILWVCLGINCTYVILGNGQAISILEMCVSERSQSSVFTSSNSGRYIARSRNATTVPRMTKVNGSISAIMVFIALLVSVS